MLKLTEFEALQFTEDDVVVPPPSDNPFDKLPEPPSFLTMDDDLPPHQRKKPSAHVTNPDISNSMEYALKEIKESGRLWMKTLENSSSRAQLTIKSLINAPIDYAKHIHKRDTKLEEMQSRLNVLEKRVLLMEQQLSTNRSNTASNNTAPPSVGNWKGNLQERCALREYENPKYATITEGGKVNSPMYVASCTIAEIPHVSSGTGTSIKSAEQDAAFQAMKQLNWPPDRPDDWEREQIRREAAAEAGSKFE